jgi:hypothetical protein
MLFFCSRFRFVGVKRTYYYFTVPVSQVDHAALDLDEIHRIYVVPPTYTQDQNPEHHAFARFNRKFVKTGGGVRITVPPDFARERLLKLEDTYGILVTPRVGKWPDFVKTVAPKKPKDDETKDATPPRQRRRKRKKTASHIASKR